MQQPRTLPSATFRSRPHGPRPQSPKLMAKSPLGNVMDLTGRFDEASPAYYSPRSSSSTLTPASPFFSAFLHAQATPSPSQMPQPEPDPASDDFRASPPYSSPRSSLSASAGQASPFVCALPFQGNASDSRLSSPMPSRTSDGRLTPVSDRPTSSATLVSNPVVKVIPKRPALPHPPALGFESVPVPHQAMTLEAAEWTLSSEELQELVSHAIRKSAEDSFIRLVPLYTFDEELTAELERLSTLQATTQAQYRFKMHRRAMLLQSLHALSFNQSTESNDGDALANLSAQLAELTIACDRLMETLLSVADQRAQIQHMRDVHIASSLAMGLRKLNASYGKRKAEVRALRAERDELRTQLHDAWLVAEDMAHEMDYLDAFQLNDEAEADYTASIERAQVVRVSGTAVATAATLTSVPGGSRLDVPGDDHARRVSAARERSSRAVKSGLRSRSRSASGVRPGPSRRTSRSRSVRKPSLSTKIAGLSTLQVDPVSLKGDSFLEMAETRPTTPASAIPPEVPGPVPPVPRLPDLESFRRKDALDVPGSDVPSKSPLSTAGIDRSFIPCDTEAYASPYTPGDNVPSTHRTQSLSVSPDNTSKLDSLLRPIRRSKSEDRIPNECADSVKPQRHTMQLRAVGEVILPAPMHAIAAHTHRPVYAAAGDGA